MAPEVSEYVTPETTSPCEEGALPARVTAEVPGVSDGLAPLICIGVDGGDMTSGLGGTTGTTGVTGAGDPPPPPPPDGAGVGAGVGEVKETMMLEEFASSKSASVAFVALISHRPSVTDETVEPVITQSPKTITNVDAPMPEPPEVVSPIFEPVVAVVAAASRLNVA